MLRIIILYGVAAGLICIGSITLGLILSNGQGPASSQWLGYLIMIVALSLIFFGIRHHRNKNNGGKITFFNALGVGLSISAIATMAYVISWEVYLSMSGTEFIDSYTQGLIDKEKAKGVSTEKWDAFIIKMEAMKTQYANPLYRIPITCSEIFPVGAIVSIVSAIILRKK